MSIKVETFSCHSGCAACCIAPSISSKIPGMSRGKPAAVRCIQLTGDNRCSLFGLKERPPVCSSLQPSREMCGAGPDEALNYLTWLERETGGLLSNGPELPARLSPPPDRNRS